MDPRIQGGSIAGQVFKPYPEFLGLFEATFEVIKRIDWSVDLGAGRQAQFHRTPGQPVCLRTVGSGGPSNEHGRFFAGPRLNGKHKDPRRWPHRISP